MNTKNNSHVSILVLDDEMLMVKLLARMLANEGYTSVTTCGSGHAALDYIDRQPSPPDIILLDLNMPGMDGIEFLRHLEHRHYSGGIILVSGEDERMQQTAEKLVRAHQIKILGHLQKPATPAELSALLESWTPHAQGKVRGAAKTYGADEVRSAIDHGELVNYYQPKVAVATGQVAGVETLVRWQHPQDGLVMPSQFVDVAETHGLIDQLTRQVITQAIDQASAWRKAGLALRVAVNVSMSNLNSLDFADVVAEKTAASGLSAKDITLEVTESRLMEDPRAPLETITRLRLKRFRLSIDDFGTGHSTLVQLRDIPFDELKIDQSFVHGACDNKTVRAMFDASLGLARQLDIEAVAEGVEDRADWDFVRNSSCDLAQGYFIARPMPADEIPAWIDAWQGQLADLMAAPERGTS